VVSVLWLFSRGGHGGTTDARVSNHSKSTLGPVRLNKNTMCDVQLVSDSKRLPSSAEKGVGGGGDQGHLLIVPVAASIMNGATCRSARTPCSAWPFRLKIGCDAYGPSPTPCSAPSTVPR
jgi:hypothetical protein